jgi:hypothetical protein
MDYADNIKDFISAVGAQDYVNSSSMFNELVAGKLHDAIEAKKIEVASNVFGETVPENTDDVDYEVTDIDEEEWEETE